MDAAEAVLHEDHWGLPKVKDRILDYLAVRKLKPNMKGPILCFVDRRSGQNLHRPLHRARDGTRLRAQLVGVVRDEAEIRGHRRTYVGALPGRIVHGMTSAEKTNPVFMMDEVDKLGLDFRGDPSAALLEVLDPAQNFSFSDHYLEMPLDLSEVMFITTANLLDPIPAALLDRMEVIAFPGYTEYEKLEIAHRFLVTKQRNEHGLSKRNLQISDAGLLELIRRIRAKPACRTWNVKSPPSAAKWRGGRFRKRKPVPCSRSTCTNSSDCRVSTTAPPEKSTKLAFRTALALTPDGGETLPVEVSLMTGKGILLLTG